MSKPQTGHTISGGVAQSGRHQHSRRVYCVIPCFLLLAALSTTAIPTVNSVAAHEGALDVSSGRFEPLSQEEEEQALAAATSLKLEFRRDLVLSVEISLSKADDFERTADVSFFHLASKRVTVVKVNIATLESRIASSVREADPPPQPAEVRRAARIARDVPFLESATVGYVVTGSGPGGLPICERHRCVSVGISAKTGKSVIADLTTNSILTSSDG